MSLKLNYQNLVEQLKRRVPKFVVYYEEEEDSLNAFVFFVHFLRDSFNDQEVIKPAADFISEMAEIDDVDVKVVIEDLLLDLYFLFTEQNTPVEAITN